MRTIRAIALFVSIVIFATMLPSADVWAYFLSPYTAVETTAEGVTIYTNKDGSKTAIIAADNTFENADENEPDRLIDRGEILEGVDDTTSVQISDQADENSLRITLKKNGTMISFTPVADDIADQSGVGEENEDNTKTSDSTDDEPLGVPDSESNENQIATPTNLTPPDVIQEDIKQDKDIDSEINAEEKANGQSPENQEADATSESEEPEEEENQIRPSVVSRKMGFRNGTYDSVIYENIFLDSDIKLQALKSGVKEDIIIHEYSGNHTYSYEMSFAGLTPRQNGQEIQLLNANNEIVAIITAPFMTDAKKAYSEDIQVQLEQLGGDKYLLTIIPDDGWLKSTNRMYPVTIDPTITYTSSDTFGIEDNYVSSGTPDTVNQYNKNRLTVGNDGSTQIMYVRPVVPSSLQDVASNSLITSASIYMYENSGNSSSQNFSIHRVTGSWTARDITYNTRPSYTARAYQTQTIYGAGWYSWDLTEMFSEWFNVFNQQPNYGFALVANGASWGDYRLFTSADTPTNRMYYSVTYYEYNSSNNPNLTVSAFGNGSNSSSGYINLSWSSLPAASAYYVGIFNGSSYEYFYVGNTNTFTTKNKKIWPTQAEIASGRYRLHADGLGTELPMIPAFTYANAGSTFANSLNYYFQVVPVNAYGQAIDPGYFGFKSIKLPDTLPPNQPSAVAVSPSSWTNADQIAVSWSGVTDYNNTSSGLLSSLGTGKIQYSIDSTLNWINTDKNSATGSYNFATTGLLDGTHSIYIRGVDSDGNTGSPKGTNFFVDKTPPTAPTLNVVPDTWTNQNAVSLSWSGIADLNNLASVECSFDGGVWKSTGIADKSFSGYNIDISALSSGSHTLTVRGIDIAGNNGVAASALVYKDSAAPTISTIYTLPAGWTTEKETTIQWSELKDIHSGLKGMSYKVALGTAVNLPDIEENGNFKIDTTAFSDGQHPIEVSFFDNLNNALIKNLTVQIDRTNPQLNLTSPVHGDIVSGSMEVWGSVLDTSIDEWELTAKGSDGQTITINKGTSEKNNELLGVFNTSPFDDGESIEIILSAKDKAGNTSSVTGVVIKVDKSAKPVLQNVSITSPSSGEVITKASVTGAYETSYAEDEAKGYLYIDGKYMGETLNKQFPFDAITYDDNTSHSISVVSESNSGELHYSNGLSAFMLLSDTFADESYISSKSNITLSSLGAKVDGASVGTVISKTLTSPKPILSLRLKSMQITPSGSSVEYFYSVDTGMTWSPIQPGQDVAMKQYTDSVMMKAVLNGSAQLLNWELEGVIEMNPMRVTSRLLRNARSFSLTAESTITQAFTEIQTSLNSETIRKSWLFVNNEVHKNSLRYDALTSDDNATHNFIAIVQSIDGTMHVSGNASSHLLLRENVQSGGTVKSNIIQSTELIYAIRLETLTSGREGKYFYSFDDIAWKSIEPDDVMVLNKGTNELYLKAEMPSGALLRSWHLEGVTGTAKEFDVVLLKNPENVVAADWGKNYPNQQKYVLTWTDPNEADSTEKHQDQYAIYKNGVFLTNVTETKYIDTDYDANAEYTVSIMREYDSHTDDHEQHVFTRDSNRVAAKKTIVEPEVSISGENFSVEEYEQSQSLNDLYGGNYTFSDLENPPAGNIELDQKLLGKNKYCAIGFEPINFNTGNFFLETQDYYLPDLGKTSIDFRRTYNTKSQVLDGPFGARWDFAYAQHLILYKGGSIGYKRADGSQINFRLQKDGSYFGNDDDNLTFGFNKEKTEYHIAEKDGTVTAFGLNGLLKYIRSSDGNTVRIERDDKGFMIAIVSQTGAKVLVTMDKKGHITKIITPGGAKHTYTYAGNNLTSHTDGLGNTTKYVYDKKGRMVQWYDANGVQQVNNQYDDNDRVVWQTDGNGGEYTLEYNSNRTITKDAEGNANEIWFDSQKRVVKQVDAKGNKTLYSYDAKGNLVGTTDALGRLTAYEFDERGNKIKDIAPDGSIVIMGYDSNNNMISLTDQLGKETKYEYDTKGNLIKQINPDKSEISYEYNFNGQLTKQKDALGGVSTFEYNGALLAKTTDALGIVTKFEYDIDSRLIATIDALGNKTRYEYDAAGNQIKLTFADDTNITYTYDALGNRTSMTDPKGNVTKFEYDALGNLIATTNPNGKVSRAEYSLNNLVTKISDALNNTIHFTYDERGNKTSQTDALGNTTRFEYDSLNRLVAEILPTGAKRTYKYDETTNLLIQSTDETGMATQIVYDKAGNITEQKLPNGGSILFEYDDMNRLIKQTSAVGGVTTLAYDKAGRLISATNPTGGVTKFEYDALGNLIKTINPAGGVRSTQYDALNRVASTTDELGAKTTYTYDAVGNLIKTTDALGNAEVYEYDEIGSLARLTDALGNTMSFGYDSNGNLTKAVKKNGGMVFNQYDDIGRVVKETDVRAASTSYEYNANGMVTKITDSMGNAATISYDKLGNITKLTAPNGTATLYEYEFSGRAKSITDELGTKTTFGYDSMNNITAVTSNGNTTKYTYDKAGNITSVTDAEGRVVQFEYDKMGNLKKTIYPDGSSSSTEYDTMGRVLKQMPRTGLKTEYTYDAAGNITSIQNGDRVTKYQYDILGRMIQTIYPDNTVATFEYDALGNLVGDRDALGNKTAYTYDQESMLKSIAYANGSSVHLNYDLAGNIISEVDAEGNRQFYAYDSVGRMKRTTDALGNITAYEYDSMDNVTKITDALGHATQYAYDKIGNLISETDAIGNTVRYSYTPEGWLEKITKADGKVIQYTYDKTGNIVAENYAGEQTVTNTYNSIGKLTVTTDAEGETKYQYDSRGYLLQVAHPNGDVIKYTYDSYGRKSTLTYPDGKRVQYEYDNMDRLVKVVGLDDSATTYEYDALGQRIKTVGSTLTTEYRYDTVGNLIKQSTVGKANVSFEYEYDKNNLIKQEVRTEDATSVKSNYTYDAMGQITNFAKSDGYRESYSYDAVGNMLNKNANGLNISMTYNAANQMVSMESAKGKIAYSYNKNGDLVEKSMNGLKDTYSYNVVGRLSAYSGYDGYMQKYTYNPQGMMRTKESKGKGRRLTLEEIVAGKDKPSDDEDSDPEDEWLKTSYIYDITQPYHEVLTETTNGKTTSYDYGIERLSANTYDFWGSQKTEYIYDGRGSVAKELNYSNAWYNKLLPFTENLQVKDMSYTPFGEQLNGKQSGYGFNGEYYDAATGMINLRARQYEPAMNRFSQKDMLRGDMSAPLSLNRYLYVENDPVNFVDPSGMFWNTLVNGIKSVATKAFNAVSKIAAPIISGVKKVATTFVSTVKTVATKINTNLNTIGNKITSLANKVYNKAVTIAVTAKTDPVKAATDLMKATSSAISYAKNAVPVIQSKLQSNAKSLGTILKDTKQDISNTLTNMAKSVYGTLPPGAQNIIKKAKDDIEALKKAGTLTDVEAGRILLKACTELGEKAVQKLGQEVKSTIIKPLVNEIVPKDLQDDLRNFNINNQNEQTVLNSNYFSGYKGSLVIRHDIPDATSCGIFKTIFLNKDENDVNNVQHEKGHLIQEEMMGEIRYIEKIAIPSLSNRDPYDVYFNNLWERGADYYGGVTGRKDSAGNPYTYTTSEKDAIDYMNSP